MTSEWANETWAHYLANPPIGSKADKPCRFHPDRPGTFNYGLCEYCYDNYLEAKSEGI